MKLEGRVAIVTGAGQGIGRAIAQKLSEEGARVIVADKNAETAVKASAEIGGLVHVTDVSDQAQVGALMATTADRFGKIDILVSDAAIVPFVPWEELDFTEWRRVMSVNIDGVLVTRRGNDVAAARLIVGSVGSVPFAADTAALAGDPAAFGARVGACAEQASAGCAPLPDGEASPDYLRHLVAVYARQALVEAFSAS